jgi:hypothetical protein
MLRSLFLPCLLRVLANMLSAHTVVDAVFVVGEFCLLYKNCTLSHVLSIKFLVVSALFQFFKWSVVFLITIVWMPCCLFGDFVCCVRTVLFIWMLCLLWKYLAVSVNAWLIMWVLCFVCVSTVVFCLCEGFVDCVKTVLFAWMLC